MSSLVPMHLWYAPHKNPARGAEKPRAFYVTIWALGSCHVESFPRVCVYPITPGLASFSKSIDKGVTLLHLTSATLATVRGR